MLCNRKQRLKVQTFLQLSCQLLHAGLQILNLSRRHKAEVAALDAAGRQLRYIANQLQAGLLFDFFF